MCVFARALVSAGEIPEMGWVAIIDAMVTMLFGFLLCTCRKSRKRLLAFHHAQLSYVFFGLGLSVFGSQLAFDGAVCHIFNQCLCQDAVLPRRRFVLLYARHAHALAARRAQEVPRQRHRSLQSLHSLLPACRP